MKARLLFVDDDETFRGVLHRELVGFGHEVESFARAEDALEFLRADRVDVALLDLRMPGMDGLSLLREIAELDSHLPVIILTGHGSFPDAVAAMRAGAFDFLGKPVPLDELELVIERAIEHGSLRRRNRLLRKLIDREVAPRVLGESAAIVELREAIERVAPTEARVLIQGESGTGKELVAHAIHDASSRAEAAFVVVNCAAIPAELFESELFGHRRGAFTGAAERRPGLIELAEGGTLFLDEIGELPMSLQPALLRAVQFGEYRPLGAERAERADVRFLAATNRDLQDAMARGEFREDLYHRIASLTLHVPPLRERGGDVRLLAERLLDEHNEKRSPDERRVLTADALAGLQAHDWTGNVRELENVIVRLVTLVESPRIEAVEVERHLRPIGRRDSTALPSLDLETLERSAIVQALTRHSGHRGRAAAELGVATKTLYNKIRHHDIAASEWGS